VAGESGLDALEIACEITLESGIISAGIVLNELRRLMAPNTLNTLINVPDGIILHQEPLANCHRYDSLRGETYAC
jgi:hypothetical protein